MSKEPRSQYHRYRSHHRKASFMAFFGVTGLMLSSILFFVTATGAIGYMAPFIVLAIGLFLVIGASAYYEFAKQEFIEMTGMTPEKFRRHLDREQRRKRRV